VPRPCQGIHPIALAVGLQGVAAGVFGEAGHHRDRGGSFERSRSAGAQQGIGASSWPSSRRWALATAHPDGLIGGHHRSDREAQGARQASATCRWRSCNSGSIAASKSRPRRCWRTGARARAAAGKAIERPALHVVEAGIAPVEGGPIHHIGMGDQAAAGGGQQPRCRQAVAGKTADLAADPGRDQQQGGAGAHTGSGAQQHRLDPQPAPTRLAISGRLCGRDRPAQRFPLFPQRCEQLGSKGPGAVSSQRSNRCSFILPGANGLGPSGAAPSLELPELQLIHSIFLAGQQFEVAAGVGRRTGGRNPRLQLGLYPHRFALIDRALAQLGGRRWCRHPSNRSWAGAHRPVPLPPARSGRRGS